MASYRELQPGLYELDTPSGKLPVTATEDELRANGHFPEALSLFAPGSGALAQNGGAGGVPNVPGAAPAFGPQGLGGSPAQKLDQDVLDGAPSNPLVQKLSPNTETVNMTRETQPLRAGEPTPGNRGLRGGGEVKQIGEGGGAAAPEQRARFAKVGGKDIRAGFAVQKSGIDPADIEAAEEAEADASIDRKLGAQNIADRRATQTEAISAEMGRQIRREGVALRQQEERNRAREEDYTRRMAAIEKERDDVAKMNVTVADYVDDGDMAGIIGAIAVLAAVPDAVYSGRNAAIDAIEGRLDKKMAQAREKLAGEEGELDRLTKLYGSPAEAEAEYRDRQRLLIQSMAQKMATDAGATDAADNLRMQFADWDDQRAQSRLARQASLADRVTEQWQHMPERVVQVGGPRPMKPEARERAVRLPNGQFAFARTKNDAEKAQSQLTAGNAVLEGIGKLKAVMADGQPWDPDKRARAQSIAAGLALDGKNADQAGALDAGTQEIMSKMFSDPSEMFNPAAVSRLEAAAERQRGKTSGIVRDYLHVDPEATTPLAAARPQSARAD